MNYYYIRFILRTSHSPITIIQEVLNVHGPILDNIGFVLDYFESPEAKKNLCIQYLKLLSDNTDKVMNSFNSPIIGMLYNNVYTRVLPIHEDFPKETLVQIFRPFLYYYYIIAYGENDYAKTYKYRMILNKKFQPFIFSFRQKKGMHVFNLIVDIRFLNMNFHLSGFNF